MRALSIPLLVVGALLAGCGGEEGPNLPVGWEEATLLIDFGQTACLGDPLDDPEATQEINASLLSGSARITWTNALFRCEQDVEAYIRRDGTRVDVLVQPVEILPEQIARCDCYYDLDMSFNVDDSLTAIGFYTRNDEIGGPSSPSLVGTLTVQ
jgi:hypothetical protein